MKILTNQKVKKLFSQILLCIVAFTILSVMFLALEIKRADLYILLCSLSMAIGVLVACCRYFKQQNRIMEDAAEQITKYISDGKNSRIECDNEGELYRLLHEVNSLVSILDAQAENEGKTKEFLKNTISDISHQLKTPLAALNIYNGIIQAEAEAMDLPTIKEFSALSEQELERIQTLVQNLLKITKFDAGAIAIDRRIENISDMMEDIKKYFRYRAMQEGKQIVLSGNSSLSFLCDRNWMLEAMSNIVKNALDHTKRGDCIWVEWEQFASIVRITVKDNGSGIHPEDLYHIFKRFYRSRYSKDIQGIGLGLPLAKSVIEAHNGAIEVDSQLGGGTTFTINFLIPTKL